MEPSDSLGVAHLIRAYQFNGHRKAKLDPLDLHTDSSFPWGARLKDKEVRREGGREKKLKEWR